LAPDAHPDIAGLDLRPCMADCFPAGMGVCNANGQLQMCNLGADGCLHLSAPTPCGFDQLCCSGACVTVDEKNCFQCGRACTGQTPKCSPITMTCACTLTSCPNGYDCDPSGVCSICADPPVPETRTDFYVDVHTSFVGKGTPGCPYAHVGDGITEANTNNNATATTVHIAPGTYNVGTGEIFPLVLRKGVSLVGADPTTTIIEGIGPLDHTGAGGALNIMTKATIVAGDTMRPSTISNLTVRPSPSPATPTIGEYGVFCDQGSALQTVANPPQAGYPAPTLSLAALTVGPGYEYGVAVTNSTVPAATGCNLKMVSSTVTGNYNGMWVVGCGTGGPGGIVAVQVGDMTAGSGNLLSKNGNGTANSGPAVVVWDCSSPVRFYNNTFDSDNIGIAIAQHPRLDPTIPVVDYIDIQNNTFSNLTNVGIDLNTAAVIDQLIGNTFTNITAAVAHGYRGAGLIVNGSNGSAKNYRPQVKRARNNQFIGNDEAVEFRGFVPIVPDPDGINTDFGVASDPGNNVFRCNSTPMAATLPGWDLYVSAPAANGGTLNFSGNQWDHSPPTQVTSPSSNAANGTDVVLVSPQPMIITGNSSVSAAMCPAGANTGP
jgi:hypothetical protein